METFGQTLGGVRRPPPIKTTAEQGVGDLQSNPRRGQETTAEQRPPPSKTTASQKMRPDGGLLRPWRCFTLFVYDQDSDTMYMPYKIVKGAFHSAWRRRPGCPNSWSLGCAVQQRSQDARRANSETGHLLDAPVFFRHHKEWKGRRCQ